MIGDAIMEDSTEELRGHIMGDYHHSEEIIQMMNTLPPYVETSSLQ